MKSSRDMALQTMCFRTLHLSRSSSIRHQLSAGVPSQRLTACAQKHHRSRFTGDEFRPAARSLPLSRVQREEAAS